MKARKCILRRIIKNNGKRNVEMKVIVKCENCGNEVEVSPVTIGKIAYWGQGLRNMNFDIDSTEIDGELLESEVSDPNDVEARLKEIRIDCRNCGDYICLDCE